MGQEHMFKDGHLGGYIQGGAAGSWCPHLWRWVVRSLGIRSVLDVGCGEGHSTRFFRELGCEVLGIDGCDQAIRDSVIPDAVLRHDFNDGPFLPPRTFDLIWSCEFLEHVERRYLPHILQTLACAEKAILVTHAFPGQEDGHHHVNCRPSSYWIRAIEPLGFDCDVRWSRRARRKTLADYPSINHFARSGLVFMRTSGATLVEPATRLDGMLGYLRAELKAWQINQGFRWSTAYFRQQRRRRKLKRQGKLAYQRPSYSDDPSDIS